MSLFMKERGENVCKSEGREDVKSREKEMQRMNEREIRGGRQRVNMKKREKRERVSNEIKRES